MPTNRYCLAQEDLQARLASEIKIDEGFATGQACSRAQRPPRTMARPHALQIRLNWDPQWQIKSGMVYDQMDFGCQILDFQRSCCSNGEGLLLLSFETRKVHRVRCWTTALDY